MNNKTDISRRAKTPRHAWNAELVSRNNLHLIFHRGCSRSLALFPFFFWSSHNLIELPGTGSRARGKKRPTVTHCRGWLFFPPFHGGWRGLLFKKVSREPLKYRERATLCHPSTMYICNTRSTRPDKTGGGRLGIYKIYEAVPPITLRNEQSSGGFLTRRKRV